MAVVVARLVERLILIPEGHGLNSVIRHYFIINMFTAKWLKKQK